MATGTTNVSAYNSLFANIYPDALLIARANCVMAQLVTTYNDSSGTEQRIFSQREQATAQNVDEGTDFASPDRMGKASLATLTPGEVMSQVVLSDRAIRQDPRVVADAAKEMGMAMAQKIDEDLISTFTSLTGMAVGTANTTLTWANVLAGQARLFAANVPGPYNVVLHPYQAYDLTTEVGLTKNLASTPDSVKNGLAEDMWLGSFQNMNFYVSNNIEADGSDDAVGAMFSSEAIALDVRIAPHGYAPEFDASARETEFNLHADYAFGVRRPLYGGEITSDVTAPS